MRLLVVTNTYPSEDALYRNGFVHRRVVAYQQLGHDVVVFSNSPHHDSVRWYEFDGVKIMEGRTVDLTSFINEETFDAILMHFVAPQRIQAIADAEFSGPVLVWLHGFEAEAWHRRWYSFIDSSASIRKVLQERSSRFDEQLGALSRLATEATLNASFVTVSEWFKNYRVEPDIGHELADCAVIPNFIDPDLFPYHSKLPSDRLRILSIRPFASRKYANDLTAEAIEILSDKEFFDELEFTICGEGRLFETETQALRKFDNVTLHNKFFTQHEIAELHRQHGIFLAPTRLDSQGVSMCEAMSSGLVAISTNIAAIPEFITHNETGLLARPESGEELADAIERLYCDADLFARLSQAGSDRMRAQCGPAATVQKELELIEGKVAHE